MIMYTLTVLLASGIINFELPCLVCVVIFVGNTVLVNDRIGAHILIIKIMLGQD